MNGGLLWGLALTAALALLGEAAALGGAGAAPPHAASAAVRMSNPGAIFLA